GRLAEGVNRWAWPPEARTACRRPWPAGAGTARRRLLFLDRRHHLGREEPAQLSGAYRRDFVDIDSADSALLELERMARSDQPGAQFANTRLVSNQRDARLAAVFLEVGQQRRVTFPGCERLDSDDRRPRVECGRDDIRRLTRANQRARQYDVDPDVEPRQTARRLLET